MKYTVKILLSIFNKIISFVGLVFNNGNNNIVKTPRIFFRSSYSIHGKLNSIIMNGEIGKTRVGINGQSNEIFLNNIKINNSSISITGDQNQIVFDQGVRLNNSSIIIKGDNCKISIGENSVFFGVRIVNAGKNNPINIGHSCLFSDFIEVWASDTHPIYNQNAEIINQEKAVLIGNNVWVGSRVIILKGTSIGDGSVIGMGTLVVNDVPLCSISVGNPNRVVKENIIWTRGL